jgi:predicted transcriptional regulator
VNVLSRRRRPAEISLELLNFICDKDRASKWDLIKILGNTEQFRNWVDGFLLKDGLIEMHENDGVTYYQVTKRGELFHKLLKNGNIMSSFLRISGKRLA